MSEYRTIVSPKFLQACLEYSLSFCNSIEELETERERILPIFKKMYNNINIMFDEEDFKLNEFFKSIINRKREELATLSKTQDSETLLDSAIQATEESTRTGEINEQTQKIKSIEISKAQAQEIQKTVVE